MSGQRWQQQGGQQQRGGQQQWNGGGGGGGGQQQRQGNNGQQRQNNRGTPDRTRQNKTHFTTSQNRNQGGGNQQSGQVGNPKVKIQGQEGATEAGCNDIVWTIVFWLHFLIMIGMAGYYIYTYKEDFKSGGSSCQGNGCQFFSLEGYSLCVVIMIIALLCAVGWLAFIHFNAECLVKCTIFTVIGLFVVGAAFLLYIGATVPAVMCLIIGALFCLWAWCVWDRIEFAAVSIKLSTSAINQAKGVLCVSLGSVFAQVAWIFLWLFGAVAIFMALENGDKYVSGAFYPVVIFLLLSFYWTSQVIKSVVHVTCSGAIAMWYFFGKTDSQRYEEGGNSNFIEGSMPSGVACGAFGRALGSYFGSIAFGAFIIAVIKTLRMLIRMAAHACDQPIITCCCMCILGCIDKIFEFFNHYTLVQVAVYGKKYCDAAKSTWALFKGENGEGDIWDAVMNDEIVDLVVFLTCMVSALVTGILGMLLCSFVPPFKDALMKTVVPEGGGDPVADGTLPGMYFFIGLLTGYVITLCAMIVVESGVSTIFVLYIEQPEAFAASKKQEYGELTAAWRQIGYPDPIQNKPPRSYYQ